MEAYFKIGAFHSAKSRSKRVLSVMCSGIVREMYFALLHKCGNNTRWRTTDHIMDEIGNDVRDFKIGEIQFDDDTITVNKKNLFSLCDELEKLDCLGAHLMEQRLIITLTNKEMYKRMYNSGCYQITLACESGVQRVLDDVIYKAITIRNNIPFN